MRARRSASRLRDGQRGWNRSLKDAKAGPDGCPRRRPPSCSARKAVTRKNCFCAIIIFEPFLGEYFTRPSHPPALAMSTEDESRVASGRHASGARERVSRAKTVDSLMTREKFRLAEEVIELTRVNHDFAKRVKLANAEVVRTTSELRKREREAHALARGEHDAGETRRATRILELEAENEVYFSEVSRLAGLLRLDVETGAAENTNKTSDAATSAEVTRLRLELAFGAKHLEQRGVQKDPFAENGLLQAETRAVAAEAKVAKLESLAKDLQTRRDATQREKDTCQSLVEKLTKELDTTREDAEHFKRLAAMEAAACAQAVEEKFMSLHELEQVRPELDSLRIQISEIDDENSALRVAAEKARASETATLAKVEAEKNAFAAANSDRQAARDQNRVDLRNAMKAPLGFVARRAALAAKVENANEKKPAPKMSAATRKRLGVKPVGDASSKRFI